MDYGAIESTVNRTLSQEDMMYVKGGEGHYFSVGRSTQECVDISLRAARTNDSDVRWILDLPCGHGRVLRYLRAAFPEAEITACGDGPVNELKGAIGASGRASGVPPAPISSILYVDMGMRPVFNPCSGAPGGVPNAEVNPYLGNPG